MTIKASALSFSSSLDSLGASTWSSLLKASSFPSLVEDLPLLFRHSSSSDSCRFVTCSSDQPYLDRCLLVFLFPSILVAPALSFLWLSLSFEVERVEVKRMAKRTRLRTTKTQALHSSERNTTTALFKQAINTAAPAVNKTMLCI
ncbi:hypothetical protein TorRG33x02_347410 [Trema orientale]|uniref:Transmembrane protein n=1 Tax=Trema orientale TaxID=63057 RepID=A0A2P5ALM5_TREOI|nr:hypothetical protein TorRG33x02_347410 [Trema orientale]